MLPPPVPEPHPEPIDNPWLPEPEPMTAEQLLAADVQPPASTDGAQLKAVLEAVIYVTEEPLSLQQIAGALQLPMESVKPALDALIEDYNGPERGISIREVAGGYKMGTKPEHHEAVRTFAKNLKPPLKLSLAALETLAVIAYKQPITAPEILEIRGVQGAGVLKTLLDRKLITTAGRKNVIGKPILYRTTKEFLLQFGLKDLSELPTLKEFEELRRLALTDADEVAVDSLEPSAPPADEAAVSAAAAAVSEDPADPSRES
jgi:segregation and condensation protein B